MAPIRYSLHYEDYSEHLMSRFGKLLQMQSLVDMTLMCSSHTLRVHKAVLAASSAYFQVRSYAVFYLKLTLVYYLPILTTY